MSSILQGLYRGIVEDDKDPQKRLRYRVRVYTVHAPGLDVKALPWAEMGALPAEHNAGFFPSFRIGERVWVMFEQGNDQLPVIMGGWIASPKQNNDIPPELQEDYPYTCKRMILRDRNGNTLEFSEIPRENWVRLVVGDVQIKICQNDKSIHIETPKGTVQTVCKKSQCDALEVVNEAKKITNQASGTATGQGTNLQLGSVESTNHGDQLTNHGGYTSLYKGVLYKIFQSIRTWIRAKRIDVGVPTGTMDQGGVVPTTDSVNQRATQAITDDCEGNSSYQAKTGVLIATHQSSVHATSVPPTNGDLVASSSHDLNMYAVNNVFTQAGGTVTVTADGKITVTTLDAVDIIAAGIITVKSDIKVKIQAPSVEISS